MSEHYNQDYTKEEAEVILQKIKDCINDNCYIISQNENRKKQANWLPIQVIDWDFERRIAL